MESVNQYSMEIRNLGVCYGKKTALEQVSLSLPRRGITAVIGPSGCGKTTFLHSLNGMLRENPEAHITGQILLNGQNTAELSPEALRRQVGLVFQTPSPFPFSIYKNMTYGLKYYGMKKKEDLDKAVEETLRVVGLYEEVKEDLHKSALKLSGGQQQRLCIARAISVEPKMLLLDEPCSALDVRSTAVIEELLLSMKERYAMVVVTHNIAQARRIGDNVAMFFEGHLVEYGNADALFQDPKEQLTREFLSGVCG